MPDWSSVLAPLVGTETLVAYYPWADDLDRLLVGVVLFVGEDRVVFENIDLLGLPDGTDEALFSAVAKLEIGGPYLDALSSMYNNRDELQLQPRRKRRLKAAKSIRGELQRAIDENGCVRIKCRAADFPDNIWPKRLDGDLLVAVETYEYLFDLATLYLPIDSIEWLETGGDKQIVEEYLRKGRGPLPSSCLTAIPC